MLYILYIYCIPTVTPHTHWVLSSLFVYMDLLLLLITLILSHHNSDPFPTGGATYDDSPSKRYIYKFYHKEIKVINNKCYAVFSVTGDVFLKGQVARMMGIIIGIHV